MAFGSRKGFRLEGSVYGPYISPGLEGGVGRSKNVVELWRPYIPYPPL